MAKRNNSFNESKLNRFLKEGRGSGVGDEYKPWLCIQDFPSQGRASRVYGWKTGRVHHFFTDIQTKYFYLLEWEDCVKDIREHYPLLETKDIYKDDINLNTFKDKETGFQYILTTTFLITISTPQGNVEVARSIKSASEFEKKHVIEKFEFERRYWASKGIEWGIVTQREIPRIKAKNVQWVHATKNFEGHVTNTDDEARHYCELLCDSLINSTDSIRKVTADFDLKYGLDEGSGLFIFKHLIANKIIKVDMNKEIDMNKPSIEIIKEIKMKGVYNWRNAANS